MFSDDNIASFIISADKMFPELDKLKVKKDYHKLLQNGNCLDLNAVYITERPEDDERFCVYDETGNFYGIYQYESKTRMFTPVKMFISET